MADLVGVIVIMQRGDGTEWHVAKASEALRKAVEYPPGYVLVACPPNEVGRYAAKISEALGLDHPASIR